MTGAATIVVTRDPGGYRDKLRAYKVLLDGEVAGKVRRGEQVTVITGPGRHRVQLKIDWCTSPPVDLWLEAGQVVRLRCAPGGSAMQTLPAITYGSRRYVQLDIEPPEELER